MVSFSDIFQGKALKIIFAVFISLASLLMLKPVKGKSTNKKRYQVNVQSGDQLYPLNLFVIIPVVLVTGFISGMVGISGGSFLVPLMVLVIGVPMHIAVGTSTALVMFTALAGFLGHLSTGHFDAALAVPLAASGALGAFVGTRLTIRVNPKMLKVIFASTSFLAAVIMVIKVFYS
ncbi:MAG: sulfite exporter TauE/SafE family protein [Bacteroidales bacterium]|nr:sulfite exporter TauE/SafE family protein [Bacteroidales bacterium]